MTATQAPTPGPMDSESVKLLVKGDFLLCADRIIRSVEQVDAERGVLWFTDGEACGPSVCAFIGRPDKSRWMPWPGGENPVPGQAVEVRFRSGAVKSSISDHFDWSHETRRRKHLSRSVDIIAFRLISKRAAALSELAALDGETMDLAPTAPVEASGSEREHGPKCWGKTSISDEMMYCYCGSTDSPSGETREALGGQKGDSETLRVLLDNLVIAQTLSKDIRQKATDEARSYLYDLRHTPQPSGETRESGDYTMALAEVQPFEDYPALADHIERMATTGRIGSMIEWDGFLSQLNATILALLSARPLALGGQQGGIADIVAERRRQVEAEGWSIENDDEHDDCSLAHAAAAYALGEGLGTKAASYRDDVSGGRGETPVWGVRERKVPLAWPSSWDARWWKPSNRRRDLVKAGALIVAEIERLDRAEGAK